jgi:quinohemoprotein ethanol dehydrogenase
VRDYGWHHGEQPRRLLTFALNRHAVLPPTPPPRFTVDAVDDPAFTIDAAQAAAGARVFPRCAVCHGILFQNTGASARDLRQSTLALRWEEFYSVVRDGALMPLGMPRYAAYDPSDEDLRDLYQFVRQRAREAARR